MIPRRLRRLLVGTALLASIVFAQAAVALSLCAMDRGDMAQMGAECVCETAASGMALGANGCIAHCTADLQQAGSTVPLVTCAPSSPVLLVSAVRQQGPPVSVIDRPAPGFPPRRVLLHSYLI